MQYILFVLIMLAASGSYADDPFPYQCKVMPLSDGTVMLPEGKASLVIIHNVSDIDLWVTHPISDPSASAGWSSHLQSNHWSALALDEHSFELSCIESKPGHEQQVPCSGVLTICQWFNIVSTDKQSPPYWAGENMPLPALLGHLAQRGFKLPEPK